MKKKLLLLHLLAITFFANAQNVGIGTANPVFKLDVKNGSINTDSVYRIGATTVLAVPEVGNLFIGKDAGIGMFNSGAYNTFSGNLAGSSNTIGSYNSFFGQTAGSSNTTGDQNSFYGKSTGFSNTTGHSNSFYGLSAAYNNTTGNFNTAIGISSLTNNTTGTLNTALGYNANVNTVAQTNATAIGANARVDCNNCLVLGSVNGINGAASGVNVGIGITNPNTSAQLDISSTTKGFLPPRMTGAQRNAISIPSAGLVVWCTDCGADGGELQAFNGFSWRNMIGGVASDPFIFVIGMSYMGGKIAYILQPGDPGYIAGQTHGLIAAASDQSTSAQWGCFGTTIAGADGTALGTGNQNTIDIMAGCAMAGIAARICGDLVLNGYSDWYLPSKDELNKLYINRVAIDGFANGNYWCSSEGGGNVVWYQAFYDGTQNFANKFGTYYVRAVRAF